MDALGELVQAVEVLARIGAGSDVSRSLLDDLHQVALCRVSRVVGAEGLLTVQVDDDVHTGRDLPGDLDGVTAEKAIRSEWGRAGTGPAEDGVSGSRHVGGVGDRCGEFVEFARDRVPFVLSEHAGVGLDEEIAGADRDVVGLLKRAVGQRQPGLGIGDVALERVEVAEFSGDAQSFERGGRVVARTLDPCSGGQSELSFGDAVLQGVDVALGLERLGEVGDPHDYRPTTPSRLTRVSSIWSMVDTTRAAAS